MKDFQQWIWAFFEAIGLSAFFEPDRRIYYPYLLSALVLGIGYYYILKKTKTKKNIPNLLKYLFPKSIWLHQSAIVDYQIFIFNNLLQALLLAPYLIANMAFAYIIVRWWEWGIGLQDTVIWSATYINLSYTIVFLLVSDFSRFIVHYALHKIPFLWEFHKVHHAAKVLTPMTLYRIHPLEFIIFNLRSVFVFGLVTGTFFFWFRTGIALFSVFQIHIGLFLFNLLGANLRHSHIPISFGKWLEHIFVSPAQHQIHHGKEPCYYDKNFGSLFAIWDWIFGSLYLSEKDQKIEFGIEETEQKKFSNFWQNLWSPVRNLWKR